MQNKPVIYLAGKTKEEIAALMDKILALTGEVCRNADGKLCHAVKLPVFDCKPFSEFQAGHLL
jgi:hypothetical protein